MKLPQVLIVYLCLFLAACQSQTIVTQTQIPSLAQAAFVVAPKQEGTSVPKPTPHGTISEVQDFQPQATPNTKTLSFQIEYPGKSEGFQTQAVRCNDIAYFKVSVSGIAMGAPLYANGSDGFNMIASGGVCTLGATVATVPFGLARMGKVTAYDSGRNEIPGSTIQAVFNVTSHPTNVDISYHSTPNGKIVENIINTPDPVTASHMSLANLTNLINTLTGLSGVFPHHAYATHPSLINTSALTTDLLANGGDSTLLNPANAAYKVAPGTITGTITGLVTTDQAIFQVADPSSPFLSHLHNGGFSRNNVTPGTWDVRALAQNTGTNYTITAVPPVTIAAGGSVNVGTITFTPLTPTISSLSVVTDNAGDTITINGTNFHASPSGNVVQFGAFTVPTADITVISANQLTAKVPLIASGIVAITVAVGSQTSNSINFTVLPKISNVNPNVGVNTDPTPITINGGGFQSGATITVGGTAATGVTFVSVTQLTASVPAGLAFGPHNVVVTNPDTTSDTLVNGFTSRAPIHVNHAAGGLNNGTSWANAYTSLQTAITASTSGDQIWVAQGTYKPGAVGTRTATFTLKAGVAIYGGFNGTEGNLAARNFGINVTILSGDLQGDDTGFTNNTENAYHVVTGTTGGTLDGFTITAGNANNGGADNIGGGITFVNASPTLKNLIINGNSANSQGGGLNIAGAGVGSSPTIQDTTISNNRTTLGAAGGGGVWIQDTNSAPVFTNVQFNSNTSANQGGAVNANSSSDPVFNNVTLTGNSAANGGGGMYIQTAAVPILNTVTFANNNCTNAGCSGGGMLNTGAGTNSQLTNVQFNNNVAAGAANSGGGGMYNTSGAAPVLNTVSFTSNSCTNASCVGGGMYNNGAGVNPQLTNVTFTDNTADNAGGGMYNGTSAAPVLNTATFTSNDCLAASCFGGGMYNAASNPSLTDVDFDLNQATFSGGGMYNATSSDPVLNTVTFTNNTSGNQGGGMTNNGVGTSPSLTNVIFTNNSATSQGGGMMNTSTASPTLNTVILDDNSSASGGGMTNSFAAVPVLNDVTFLNNTATQGGGMYNVDNSTSPNLTNVTFTTNSSTSHGGGMYNASGADPILNTVTFTSNFTINVGTQGGGMFSTGAGTVPQLTNVNFNTNTAILNGGGMANTSAASPILNNVNFTGNTVTAGTSSGGGMYNTNPSTAPQLTNVTFTNNTAVTSGGGMTSFTSSAPILNTVTFSGNSVSAAAGQGGGMFNNAASPSLTSVTFLNNAANGTNALGGGMYNASGANPTITSSTFTSNTANGTSGQGGGLFNAIGSGPSITNSTFTSNSAGSNGGGVYNAANASSITTTTFTTNTAVTNGGGLYNTGTGPTLTDLIFNGNQVTAGAGNGGGVFMTSAGVNPTMTNCIFLNNTSAGAGGGAAFTASASPVLNRVVFANNGAATTGGAIHAATSVAVTNGLFVSNTAGTHGGAMIMTLGTSSLINVTFRANTATGNGGALRSDTGTIVTIKNAILWANTAASGPQVSNGSVTNTISFSNVQGGVGLISLIINGGSNIDSDPVFINTADPDGVDNTYATTDDGLKLQGASPSLHTGTPTGAPAVDLVNVARPQGAQVDMGAYEQ